MMNQPGASNKRSTESGERMDSDRLQLRSAMGLDTQKYAPLLQQAGIAPDDQERYLRELAGAISAILDTYFEGLKTSEPDP